MGETLFGLISGELKGVSKTFFFFLKFLADTCPFLGPLVPLFWISGDVSSGFQSQSGFCLIRYFCGGKCNVHSPRFTSGATLADLLAAGAQPVTSPHACAEVGLGSVSNMQPQEQKTNALPLCQRPGKTFTSSHLEGVRRMWKLQEMFPIQKFKYL